eukprot:TRINITY_DN658_c0_g1_i8.p1 TRINITY_DN658_c0_g1~~TRINITY_DN658_c0_g1_i8.p1  ORF type:complete len:339 (-),score=25.93 TRINITY_DN658_c0_g1_i8:149-1165(-)
MLQNKNYFNLPKIISAIIPLIQNMMPDLVSSENNQQSGKRKRDENIESEIPKKCPKFQSLNLSTPFQDEYDIDAFEDFRSLKEALIEQNLDEGFILLWDTILQTLQHAQNVQHVYKYAIQFRILFRVLFYMVSNIVKVLFYIESSQFGFQQNNQNLQGFDLNNLSGLENYNKKCPLSSQFVYQVIYYVQIVFSYKNDQNLIFQEIVEQIIYKQPTQEIKQHLQEKETVSVEKQQKLQQQDSLSQIVKFFWPDFNERLRAMQVKINQFEQKHNYSFFGSFWTFQLNGVLLQRYQQFVFKNMCAKLTTFICENYCEYFEQVRLKGVIYSRRGNQSWLCQL